MDDEKVKTIFSNNLKKYMNMVGTNLVNQFRIKANINTIYSHHFV